MTDDLYEGFNDDEFTSRVKKSSYGRTLKTSLNSSYVESRAGRMPSAKLGTAFQTGDSVNIRPMTSVRAAGFTSSGRRKNGNNQLSNLLSGSSEFYPECKFEEGPEYKIKMIESKVYELIDESCIAASRNEFDTALEKAKDASRNEKVLIRQREQYGLGDQANLDLNYSVLFNLANRYQDTGMYQEALNTYNKIVKNKTFTSSGRLKVNMGNIYFTQKNYSKAIKFYRMGLDQVPNVQRKMRLSIMRNIGIAFVKMGQFKEAVQAFDHIMKEEADIKSGFNLILCYYLMKDDKNMRNAFQKLLRVNLSLDDEDRYLPHNDDKKYNLILEVTKNDALRRYEKERSAKAENSIKMASKIIAPVIETDFQKGYDWCIDKTRSSIFHEVAHDLEIDKAVMYLKQREFKAAIQTLKSFQKKDYRIACTAATNLSFLYFLEGDLDKAEYHAEKALLADHYNPFALVNMGNVHFRKNQFDDALDRYLEALQVDSSCFEAIFNAGLAYKNLERYQDALGSFEKLNLLTKNDPAVLYQLIDICEKLGETEESHDYTLQLHSVISTDPNLLKRLGEYFTLEGDKSQALLFYYDSFKYYPCNYEVIEWLGAYYVESQFCDKAMSYFEKAALLQPNQPKWQLLTASCHRLSGDYQKALETYIAINRKFPDNVDCLEFIVKISSDLGLPETQEYIAQLKRLEKMNEIREQRQISAQSRRTSLKTSSGLNRTPNSREGSAGGGSSGTVSREGSAKTNVNIRRKSSLKSTNRPFPLVSEFEEIGGLPPTPQQKASVMPSTYQDPLGPAAERPRTAVRTGTAKPIQDDFFADDNIDDELLPE